MRRKEREITDITEIEAIINKADACRIAMVDGDMPYVVPMNFGYINDVLYLHCAKEGRKIEVLKKNNNVCFEMDIEHDLVLNMEIPAMSTMHYKSVIGFGKAHFITDESEKIKALDALMQNYVKDKNHKFDYGKFLDIVQLIRIDISFMEGKSNYPK